MSPELDRTDPFHLPARPSTLGGTLRPAQVELPGGPPAVTTLGHPATVAGPSTSGATLRRRPAQQLLPSDRRSGRIVGLALAVLGAMSIGFPVWLSGWSMEPALANGSLMLVDRLEPELLGVSRGEIVVFAPLPHASGGYASLTKRVIGLPGDVVSVGGVRVTVNGQALLEPYIDATERAGMDGPVRTWRVPTGHVFVLGDARGRSFDSRFFGPVPISRILGRVWLVLPTPFTRP